MSQDDLRSFLEAVRTQSPRDYLVVEDKVSPVLEVAATVAKLASKMRMPILEFQQVQGSTMPVITNVCASLPRIAKGVGISPAELDARLLQAYEQPIAPRLCAAETAPVREHVYTGEEIDLYRLPQMRSTVQEEAPYLSAAAVIARDPDSGVSNISYHRCMLLDRKRAAIFMTSEGHLDRIYQANLTRQQSTAVAVFIGAHPLWALGSLAAGGMDVDELAVIGGLLGYPLAVTPSLVDAALQVPARAEIVLEGVIRHDQQAEEGPYGEALGYVSTREQRPVLEVQYMSTRKQPLFQEIIAGHIEHLNMTGTAVRIHLQRDIVHKYPMIAEIYQAGPMILYLRLAEALGNQDKSDVPELMRAILSSQRYVKQLIVFDNDVEIKNAQQTQWAIATMVQADRDIILLPDQAGNGIDPSERYGKTTKWGVDATAKADAAGARAPEKNHIPQDELDKIDLNKLLKRK